MNEQECTPSNWKVNANLAHQAAVDHLNCGLGAVAACIYPNPKFLLLNKTQMHTIQPVNYLHDPQLRTQMPRFPRDYVYGSIHLELPSLFVLSLSPDIFDWITCAVSCF